MLRAASFCPRAQASAHAGRRREDWRCPRPGLAEALPAGRGAFGSRDGTMAGGGGGAARPLFLGDAKSNLVGLPTPSGSEVEFRGPGRVVTSRGRPAVKQRGAFPTSRSPRKFIAHLHIGIFPSTEQFSRGRCTWERAVSEHQNQGSGAIYSPPFLPQFFCLVACRPAKGDVSICLLKDT